MKKTGINRKILTIVLGMSLVSLVVFCASAFGGLFSIRARMQTSSARLGEFAAANSSSFLQSEAVDKLMTKAKDQAVIISERLQSIAKDAVYFAGVAEDIYANAANLPPRPVPYSSSKNYGALVMQLRSVNGKQDYPRVKKEADLLGNLARTYESNSGDMKTMTVSVFIGTETGVFIIYDSFSDESHHAFDPRGRPWYVGAKERGGTFWTSPYVGAASGKYMVTCAHPVYGPRGEFKGVTGIDVIIDDLDREIINVGVGKKGYAFVVDSEGTLISSSQPGGGGQASGTYEKRSAYREGNETLNGVIDKMTRGATGFDRALTDEGEKYIAYAPIRATGWSVAVVLPLSEILELVDENRGAIEQMTRETLDFINYTIMAMLLIFVIVFAAVLFGVIYFSGRLSSKITRPIMTLEERLTRIAGGDLDTRIELATGDEIERLGGCVNAMTQELKRYIRNLQSVTAEKERIGAELDVAKAIQASMLPCIFPPFPDRPEFDIYALMRPAREVGGDFYDFFFVDAGTLAVVMADVSGKGVPAALFMVIAKILIKSNAQAGKSPGGVFETVNTVLCENNETKMFVTAFMGFLNIKDGKFTFVNAGHNPPILRAGGGGGFLKVKPGFVIAGMDGLSYRQDEITLRRGDELFLYTDGATDAANSAGELFGNKRLLDAVNRNAGKPVYEYAASIKRDIDGFAAGAEQADDITMLVLRYNGPAGESEPASRGAADAAPAGTEELIIDAKTENLETVQTFVAEKLEAAGCPEKLQNQIAVAIEEIFVNISNYAYSPETGSVAIRVAVGEDAVIEFEDSGRPYNPVEKDDPDITVAAEARDIGGLGIFMVKKIMDAVEYRRGEGGGNILTVRKRVV